jgi:mannose-6-phosphate isomerase-like protein (cupin superfamily)
MSVSAKEIDRILYEAKPVGGMVWNVMGQIYIPKQASEERLWWEAIMPEDTFIPPHAHSTQDEYLYIVEGELDLLMNGKVGKGTAGKVLPFPRYSNHGLFNNSGKTVKAVFWAEPTNKLLDLFKALHDVADPHEVIRLSDAHDIHFQVPGQDARTGPMAA